MKTICIIKDGRPFWNDITEYLKAVNASIFPLDLKTLLQSVSEKNPAIVIAGERAYREVSAIPQGIPRLVIAEGNIAESKSRDVYFLKWPASRESFLEMTSRLLYISERRHFKTVISIAPKGKNETYLGKSLNFSMSGMAFKVDKPLSQGDILTISFFIPNSNKRLILDAEVMRSSVNPDDGSVYYGSRFLSVKEEIKDDLESFISKIK